jgi:transcription termination factor Rho
VSDQALAERLELDKKDKGELQAIVTALGGKSNSRMKKADLVDIILELSGVTARSDDGDGSDNDGPDESSVDSSPESGDDPGGEASTDDAASSENAAEGDESRSDDPSGDDAADVADDDAESDDEQSDDDGQENQADSRPDSSQTEGSSSRRRRGKRRNDEPPAAWETELGDGSGQSQSQGRGRGSGQQKQGGQSGQRGQSSADGDSSQGNQQGSQQSNSPGGQQGIGQQGIGQQGEDSELGNRRRRRRGRGRDRDDEVEPVSIDPVNVAGFLDLRDDGYGFLRVAGMLPSKNDVYVPVKMVRQYDLRRGDLVSGLARPANRNEKNPALQQLETINDESPENVGNRPDFEDLTPLFPDERLRLERTDRSNDMTARIIDLIAPIGKGQRGLIVSPPKAGKTTIVKDIATSIEQNHPEVELVVLLIDERPEEVTDMERHLERGEVIASTFDRPSEEHCAVAELTIERAKRIVEQGKDVVVILDGITRLARAYNMAAPGTGRAMSGGIDAGALYPPKKILGAARNLEEGGSLTILATALVETGSRMDEVIFEEFKGTGNMELRLDRGLAERYVFPAIDALGSSTRRDELLMDGKEHVLTMKLRKVLAGMAAGEDGSAAAAMNLLVDRLKTFKTNAEFLNEIAKSG